MAKDITYAFCLNTAIGEDELEKLLTPYDGANLDALHFTNHGLLNKEVLVLTDLSYITVGRDGKINVSPYLGAPFPEANDFLIEPFTMKSRLLRPVVWAHKQLKHDAYQQIDLTKFEEELMKNGGIDVLQVVSPPKAGQTDYIQCDNGKRYILDKKNKQVLRF